MKNLTPRRVITWLLIASPLWWTSGCYTFVEITKLDEARANERKLEVTTKGNNVYVFTKWSADGMGGIRGTVERENPSYKTPHRWDVYGGGPKYVEGFQIVPIDSVARVKAEYPDTGMTVLGGLGILAVVAFLTGLGLLIYLSQRGSHFL